MPETQDKSPIGPVGEQVVRNVEQLRQARKMSLRDLAERLDAVGVHIVPSVLHRLSQGKRRVDADDLIALALALGVNTNALLLPRDVAADDIVQLTPTVQQRAGVTWTWADGRVPMPDGLAPEGTREIGTPGDKFADFQRHARPETQPVDPDPAVAELMTLARMLELVLADPARTQAWIQWRDTTLRRFRLAAIQIEELVARLDRDALADEAFQFDTGAAVEQLRVNAASVRESAVGFAPGTVERYTEQARAHRAGPHAAPTSITGMANGRDVDPLDPFGERGAR